MATPFPQDPWAGFLAQTATFLPWKGTLIAAPSTGRVPAMGNAPFYADMVEPAVSGRADLRVRGLLSPPKDQGNSAACTSFAIASAVEAAVRKALRPPVTLAPWFIHTCLLGNQPNQGVFIGVAVDSVMAGGIAVTDNSNAPIPPSACAMQTIYRVTSNYRTNTAQAAKLALDQGDVVACTLSVDWNSFTHLAPNAVYSYQPDANAKPHSVCLVGYDDQAGAWIIENSQGQQWADQGYGRVAYNTCDMFDPLTNGYGVAFVM